MNSNSWEKIGIRIFLEEDFWSPHYNWTYQISAIILPGPVGIHHQLRLALFAILLSHPHPNFSCFQQDHYVYVESMPGLSLKILKRDIPKEYCCPPIYDSVWFGYVWSFHYMENTYFAEDDQTCKKSPISFLFLHYFVFP